MHVHFCGILIIEDVVSMALTEAKEKANQKYKDKFVYLQARTTNEYRSTIYEHIAKTGESLNAFILRAITETMERDSNLYYQTCSTDHLLVLHV